jgi:hypothetical protein
MFYELKTKRFGDKFQIHSKNVYECDDFLDIDGTTIQTMIKDGVSSFNFSSAK